MRKREHRRLETQLQRLKHKHHRLTADIAHTACRLREAAQYERQKRLLRYGELVELAGLAHTDPGTLLGGLCELGQCMLDPGTAARCQSIGAPLLATYLQRKWHRRRPSTLGASETATLPAHAEEGH
jgi:Conjugal transfer protein TraD